MLHCTYIGIFRKIILLLKIILSVQHSTLHSALCIKLVVKHKSYYHQLLKHLDFDEDGKVTEDDVRSLVYCDFSDPKSSDKPYTEARDLEHLRTIVEGYLDEFNNMSKKPMHLVLFR